MLANPVGYNLDKFGLYYCTCYDAQQRIVPVKSLSYNDSFERFIPVPEYQNPKWDFNINLTRDVAK